MTQDKAILQTMRPPKRSRNNALKRDMHKNGSAYLLVLPVILFYLVFNYKPMYGAIIAFKDFSPGKGIWNSPWADMAGMKNFIDFFHSFYFFDPAPNSVEIENDSSK